MNTLLRNQIINHIFANFAVIPSSFVDLKKSKSLTSKEFLLPETVSFQTETGLIKGRMWGCQISSELQELKILLADCSEDKSLPEFALLVKLKDTPAYGLYYSSELTVNLMAFSPNAEWMECPTYLQATFLAGMEQVKDTGLAWNKCQNYQEHYQLLLSFLDFHNSLWGSE